MILANDITPMRRITMTVSPRRGAGAAGGFWTRDGSRTNGPSWERRKSRRTLPQTLVTPAKAGAQLLPPFHSWSSKTRSANTRRALGPGFRRGDDERKNPPIAEQHRSYGPPAADRYHRVPLPVAGATSE